MVGQDERLLSVPYRLDSDPRWRGQERRSIPERKGAIAAELRLLGSGLPSASAVSRSLAGIVAADENGQHKTKRIAFSHSCGNRGSGVRW